jgi:hypothetical protein
MKRQILLQANTRPGRSKERKKMLSLLKTENKEEGKKPKGLCRSQEHYHLFSTGDRVDIVEAIEPVTIPMKKKKPPLQLTYFRTNH